MASLLFSVNKDGALENNLELLQQIALRSYLNNGEKSKPFYNWVTSARISNEIYQRMSGRRKIEEWKQQCIGNIIAYIQKHPNASSSTLKKQIEKEVGLFAAKVSSL